MFKLNIKDDKFGLFITYSQMHTLELPALRDILAGSVGVFNAYNLCHIRTINWDEIITGKTQLPLVMITFFVIKISIGLPQVLRRNSSTRTILRYPNVIVRVVIRLVKLVVGVKVNIIARSSAK